MMKAKMNRHLKAVFRSVGKQAPWKVSGLALKGVSLLGVGYLVINALSMKDWPGALCFSFGGAALLSHIFQEGYCLMSDHLGKNPKDLAHYLAGFEPPDLKLVTLPELTGFSEERLEAIMQEAPFVVLENVGQGGGTRPNLPHDVQTLASPLLAACVHESCFSDFEEAIKAHQETYRCFNSTYSFQPATSEGSPLDPQAS